MRVRFLVFGLLAALIVVSPMPAQTGEPYPAVEQWKAAVLAGDAAGLKSLYSSDPLVKVWANGVRSDGAAADADFWATLKPHSMKLFVIRDEVSRTGTTHHSLFRVEAEDGAGKTKNIIEDQYWAKQGDAERIVVAMRTENPKLTLPSNMNRDLYPANADAHSDLAATEKRAAEGHKRVLLIFGANWCFDCHVLDIAFQRPDFVEVLAPNYEVVHVDLGPDSHKNADLVAQYEILLNKGVPALAVAEADGRLVVSQKNGEFENVRGMTAEALLDFLNRWKPAAR